MPDVVIPPTAQAGQILTSVGNGNQVQWKAPKKSGGVQGAQGTQGTQGNQGFQGNQGYQGNQGFQGNQGTQGYQGYQGNQGAIQAWAVTNANANTSMSASTTYTPSAWTITASGFSNYLVQISCTVRMTAATAGTCSIGIQVGGSLYGATSGTTYGAINAQSVTVTGSYLLSSVSGTQVIQGQVTPGASTGVFFNGNMTVIGIS